MHGRPVSRSLDGGIGANTKKLGVAVLDWQTIAQKVEINSEGCVNTQLWVLYVVNVEKEKAGSQHTWYLTRSRQQQ